MGVLLAIEAPLGLLAEQPFAYVALRPPAGAASLALRCVGSQLVSVSRRRLPTLGLACWAPFHWTFCTSWPLASHPRVVGLGRLLRLGLPCGEDKELVRPAPVGLLLIAYSPHRMSKCSSWFREFGLLVVDAPYHRLQQEQPESCPLCRAWCGGSLHEVCVHGLLHE